MLSSSSCVCVRVANKTFTVEMNEYADETLDEFRIRCGFRPDLAVFDMHEGEVPQEPMRIVRTDSTRASLLNAG